MGCIIVAFCISDAGADNNEVKEDILLPEKLQDEEETPTLFQRIKNLLCPCLRRGM